MDTTEKKMHVTAKKLFADNKVDVIIGFEAGSLPHSARPIFVRNAKDVEKLVWNNRCATNLAVYLPKLFEKPARPPKDYAPPRIAIFTKGCDGRSIAGLVKEKQVLRENLIIIGMPCLGMIAPSKNSLDKKADIGQACLECASPTVRNADIVIEGASRKAAKSNFNSVKKFEAKSAEERWKYFTAEMSRCIRCNACREACPNCYCKVCFADQRKPSWVTPVNALSDTMVFHIGRMFHQAGRCVECDACVNACPMGIDLRQFTQKLAQDSADLFGCMPGVSGDEIAPLMMFKQEDSQSFITEPEEK
ncbi:MAG: 4Fe-4S dicluster domain-containing protein [Chitinivibrionales bacterium]|nr:4Fe-4S dicluster domain-containing protein [Chitinivibrionales bacterium]